MYGSLPANVPPYARNVLHWQFIRKDPLGVVLVAAAWNYPYLIAVNSVVPAILAGMRALQTKLAA
jgi:acyl-CoA reductase-like NAD-dependent aldehyde dehydrogenase